MIRHRDVKCAVCPAKASVQRFEADLPIVGRVEWLKMPPGWWVLLPVTLKPDSLHCRCPACAPGG